MNEHERTERRITGGRIDGRAERHLASCDRCTTFATRWAAVRAALRTHRAEVEPSPGFAARVKHALPPEPSTLETLGVGALRLLPAAFALALGLSWASWQVPGPLTSSDTVLDFLVTAPRELVP